MGQACVTGKQKSPIKSPKNIPDNIVDKKEQQENGFYNGRDNDNNNNPNQPQNQQQQEEVKQVIEFLFDVSNSSLPPAEPIEEDIKKNKKIVDQYQSNSSQCFITTENIKTVYNISDHILGKGTFGTVKEASLIANPLKKFAIKCISKDSGGTEQNFDWLYREVSIFRQLDHPNVAKLYESYQDDKHFYLVMENCNGGQLLQKVLEMKRFNENMSSSVISQIFSAVKYLHELGIVHRDLKPENFLFTNDMSEIKMVDFGLSKQYNELDLMKYQMNNNNNQQLTKYNNIINNTPFPNLQSQQSQNKIQTIVGTVQYIAPEVLTGSYDNRCDIWSLGVMLYCILYGQFPFTGRNDNEIFEQIRKGSFTFKDDIKLSKQAKELIKSMICVDPKKRITLANAFKHPWFKLQLNNNTFHQTNSNNNSNSNNQNNNPQIDSSRILSIKHINNIKSYPHKLTPFQRLFIHLYFKIFTNQSFIQEHTKVFKIIDENNEGIINEQCLQKSMTSLGYKENITEITKIINNISQASVQKISRNNNNNTNQKNNNENSQCNVDRNILNQEEIQQKIFKYIDSSKTGYITSDDIINSFQREGIKCSNSYLTLLSNEYNSFISNYSQKNNSQDQDQQEVKYNNNNNNDNHNDHNNHQFNYDNNNNNNDQCDQSFKFKISFKKFQKMLNPTPPTQNNSFVQDNNINDNPANPKVQISIQSNFNKKVH